MCSYTALVFVDHIFIIINQRRKSQEIISDGKKERYFKIYWEIFMWTDQRYPK